MTEPWLDQALMELGIQERWTENSPLNLNLQPGILNLLHFKFVQNFKGKKVAKILGLDN